MKATSPQPMKKMDYMKAEKFKPAKKIAPVSSFKNKKEMQMRALKDKQVAGKGSAKPIYKSGMTSNGQPRDLAKAKKGTITSID